MKLIKLVRRKEYRGSLDFQYTQRVKHYIVELDDKEYHALLQLTKGQER